MKILLTLILSLCSLVCLSQTASNTDRYNKENIYYLSLEKYADFIGKEENTYSSNRIYIESDFKFTDSLLAKSGSIEFIVLDIEGLTELLKKEKSIVLHRLFPLNFNNGKFSVSLVPFIVTYDKRKNSFNYSNPGSYWIYYHFLDGKFIFEKVSSYGI